MTAATAPGPADLSEAELRAVLAPIATARWPIERLTVLWRGRSEGKSRSELAIRLGTTITSVEYAIQLLITEVRMDKRYENWPDQRIDDLRRLWAEGHSTREIASRLRTTHSAIVGKAHRLGLPSRPSPIRPPNPDRRSREEARRIATDNQRAKRHRRAEERVAAKPPKPIRSARLIPTTLNRPLAPAPRPKAAAYIPPPKYGRVVECCWPIGEPGTPRFHFCDVPSEPGRPYCLAHVGKAYAKIPSHTAERARA